MITKTTSYQTTKATVEKNPVIRVASGSSCMLEPQDDKKIYIKGIFVAPDEIEDYCTVLRAELLKLAEDGRFSP